MWGNWSEARTTQAGVYITQDNAMKVGVAYAAVRLIADAVSMLPMDAYVRNGDARAPYRPRPFWVVSPDIDGRPRSTFLRQWLVSKLTSHAACVRVLYGASGDVLGFSVLDPKRVEPRRDADGRLFYSIDGGRFRLSPSELIYDAEVIPPGEDKGLSRVDTLRETFGLTQALQDWSASFFGSGSTAGGIIEVPTELNGEQARQLQDGWERGHRGLRRAHRPGVLSGGAKWVQTTVNPDDAQALQAREFAVEEIARLFRIPPNMLQSQKPGSIAYSSREQDAIQFVSFTLLPYVEAIESHLSRFLPGGAFVRLNVDGLLRASLTDRYAAYSTGMQAGFLNINTIHRLEDLEPVDGGESYRVPLSHVDLAAADLTATQMRVDMLGTLVSAGFDPQSAAQAVGLPVIATSDGDSTDDPDEPSDPADDMAEDMAEEDTTDD